MRRFTAIISTVLALFTSSQYAEGKKGQTMTNRLATAASPYLRQHANNPVDWYVWGPEAFAKARKENKPIFLSIGYSTCHWCHVMERESFENEDIAKILNKYFVAIKVDRERRPDVDETYMIATQIITRSGGWPNSLFLTPDQKPFYAGTYFPRETFARLLNEIGKQWRQNEKTLIADGEHVSNVIIENLNRRVAARAITPEVLRKAGREILRDADEFNGGFDTAPKFPNEPTLMFLLQLAAGHNDQEALKAVTTTIEAILDGGIHDHVGGGFHRYATDNEWHVPHFEKMLYNQAQMVRVLLQAYRLTGRERYARAAERTITYVERQMTSKSSGFYSAWDADSEGAEGIFYVWTPQQLDAALGEKEAALAVKIFGVTTEGNLEGHTVLHFPDPPKDLAPSLNMTDQQFDETVSRLRVKLNKVREKRVPPHLDDKIILSWNGMMIAAIAEASIILEKPRYAELAKRALLFIEKNMRQADGSYLRSYWRGKAELVAQQEDYAYLALAYLHIYDATHKVEYLEKARDLADFMVTQFADPDTGDFFMVAKSDVFTRGKMRSDGATPSGNSKALEVFAMLSTRSDDPQYRVYGDRLLAALSGLAVGSPRSAAYVLRGADMMLHGEVGRVQYFAKGKVRGEIRINKAEAKVTLALSIAPGWHINADKPLHEDFIPTKLEIEPPTVRAGAVQYPKTVIRKLKFNDGEMALYEGDVEISIPFAAEVHERLTLKLSLQACSDEICLEPIVAVFSVR